MKPRSVLLWAVLAMACEAPPEAETVQDFNYKASSSGTVGPFAIERPQGDPELVVDDTWAICSGTTGQTTSEMLRDAGFRLDDLDAFPWMPIYQLDSSQCAPGTPNRIYVMSLNDMDAFGTAWIQQGMLPGNAASPIHTTRGWMGMPIPAYEGLQEHYNDAYVVSSQCSSRSQGFYNSPTQYLSDLDGGLLWESGCTQPDQIFLVADELPPLHHAAIDFLRDSQGGSLQRNWRGGYFFSRPLIENRVAVLENTNPILDWIACGSSTCDFDELATQYAAGNVSSCLNSALVDSMSGACLPEKDESAPSGSEYMDGFEEIVEGFFKQLDAIVWHKYSMVRFKDGVSSRPLWYARYNNAYTADSTTEVEFSVQQGEAALASLDDHLFGRGLLSARKTGFAGDVNHAQALDLGANVLEGVGVFERPFVPCFVDFPTGDTSDSGMSPWWGASVPPCLFTLPAVDSQAPPMDPGVYLVPANEQGGQSLAFGLTEDGVLVPQDLVALRNAQAGTDLLQALSGQAMPLKISLAPSPGNGNVGVDLTPGRLYLAVIEIDTLNDELGVSLSVRMDWMDFNNNNGQVTEIRFDPVQHGSSAVIPYLFRVPTGTDAVEWLEFPTEDSVDWLRLGGVPPEPTLQLDFSGPVSDSTDIGSIQLYELDGSMLEMKPGTLRVFEGVFPSQTERIAHDVLVDVDGYGVQDLLEPLVEMPTNPGTSATGFEPWRVDMLANAPMVRPDAPACILGQGPTCEISLGYSITQSYAIPKGAPASSGWSSLEVIRSLGSGGHPRYLDVLNPMLWDPTADMTVPVDIADPDGERIVNWRPTEWFGSVFQALQDSTGHGSAFVNNAYDDEPVMEAFFASELRSRGRWLPPSGVGRKYANAVEIASAMGCAIHEMTSNLVDGQALTAFAGELPRGCEAQSGPRLLIGPDMLTHARNGHAVYSQGFGAVQMVSTPAELAWPDNSIVMPWYYGWFPSHVAEEVAEWVDESPYDIWGSGAGQERRDTNDELLDPDIKSVFEWGSLALAEPRLTGVSVTNFPDVQAHGPYGQELVDGHLIPQLQMGGDCVFNPGAELLALFSPDASDYDVYVKPPGSTSGPDLSGYAGLVLDVTPTQDKGFTYGGHIRPPADQLAAVSVNSVNNSGLQADAVLPLVELVDDLGDFDGVERAVQVTFAAAPPRTQTQNPNSNLTDADLAAAAGLLIEADFFDTAGNSTGQSVVCIPVVGSGVDLNTYPAGYQNWRLVSGVVTAPTMSTTHVRVTLQGICDAASGSTSQAPSAVGLAYLVDEIALYQHRTLTGFPADHRSCRPD